MMLIEIKTFFFNTCLLRIPIKGILFVLIFPSSVIIYNNYSLKKNP